MCSVGVQSIILNKCGAEKLIHSGNFPLTNFNLTLDLKMKKKWRPSRDFDSLLHDLKDVILKHL